MLPAAATLSPHPEAPFRHSALERLAEPGFVEKELGPHFARSMALSLVFESAEVLTSFCAAQGGGFRVSCTTLSHTGRADPVNLKTIVS